MLHGVTRQVQNVGNMYMREHRGDMESPRCLNCSNEKEKSSHVLQCSNQSAKLNFINSVHTSIEPALDEQKTEPNLSKAIVKIICDYRRGKAINPNNYSEAHGLREAIREQNEGLKWYHFILGRWSPRWQLVQKSYLQSIGSK